MPVQTRVVSEDRLRKAFDRYSDGLDATAYETAFVYLLEGFVHYRSPRGARIFYPGTPSSHGRLLDGMEGFARFFPLGAAWLASGRSDTFDIQGRTISLTALLREGLLAGTDREGPEFWGIIRSRDQRLFESADIALGVWLTRDLIWSTLSAVERRQVSVWLGRALDVNTQDGNWALLPVMVREVLAALGEDVCCNERFVDRTFRDFKRLAMGGGWISDGTLGADYYNAWAIQYLLFWLDRINPGFDPTFIRETNRALMPFYQHMMSMRGAPLFGRSVCYRMAVPVPLLTAQVLSPGTVTAGRAMRALDGAWGYFVANGALKDGTITQGFCGADLALVNDYTAPGSCLSSARGLVVALYLDRSLGLLGTPRQKLAVEEGDYLITEEHLKWHLQGFKDTGEVRLTFTLNADGPDQPQFAPFTWKHAAREWLLRKPSRPDNHSALYGRRDYSTSQSFTHCAAAGSR